MEEGTRPVNKKFIWTGRIITTLVSLMFLMSAVMKLKGGPEVAQGLTHLGIPESLIMPLAILELTCLVIYLIPVTAVIGAILLTGYIGGAIFAHWRVGDPLFIPIAIGIAIWLGLYLREKRLWDLMPLRKR